MNNRAIYYCFTLITFILPTSLQAQECNSLAQINWLLGKWQSVPSEAVAGKPWQQLTINEQWQRVSRNTFEGQGETFKRNTLVSSESLRLVGMSGSVFYIAKVDQNELPIAFKLVSCSTTHATFENIKHDSPKRISYQHHDKERMEVNISDGKGKGFVITFNNISRDK